MELGKQWANVDSQVSSYMTLAHAALRVGKTAEARPALEKTKGLASTHVLTPGTQERIAHIESLLHEAPARDIDQKGTLPDSLTERGLEVLRLIAKGCSNPEIAEQLIIAVGTVKAHTSRIYRKLDARSRTEAVIRAQELGLL